MSVLRCASRSRRNPSAPARPSTPGCAEETTRARSSTASPPPIGANFPDSSAPTSRRCAPAGRSSTSWMNSVPSAACSMSPGWRFAPSTRPNRRLSASASRRLLATRVTKGELARGLRSCRYLAKASRPEPGSPMSSTEEACPAICCSSARSCCISLLLPAGTISAGTRSLPDWRRRLPASSALSTVRSSFASESGFSTKSNAPSRVASTAVSTVPWPDIITTGQPSVTEADHSRNSVMPSTSGIQISSSTRSGVCRAREARAWAALAATSTSYPSSERISLSRPRMSASSSTTRMCGALRGPVPAASEPRIRELTLIGKPLLPGIAGPLGRGAWMRRIKPFRAILSCPFSPQLLSSVTRTGRRPRAVDDGQQYPDTGTAFRAVVGIDPAPMLLDDLLHDREPKPRALWLARDVRVEHPAEELALEARSIVTYRKHRVPAVLPAVLRTLSPAAPLTFEPGRDLQPRLRRALERLERVGDEIVEDLPHPAPVGFDALEPRVEAQVDGGARVLRAVELGDFGDELIQVEPTHPHLRRTCVLAEGVHHLLHALDLLHDGVCGPLEDLRIARRHACQQAPPQALGGELNRGERILDLVRQATRDLAPGGVPLRLQQRRDVIENDDITPVAFFSRQRSAGAHEIAPSVRAMRRAAIE